jgi:hypothetical protein
MDYVSHGRVRVATALGVVLFAQSFARPGRAQEPGSVPGPAAAVAPAAGAPPVRVEVPPLPDWPDFSKRPAYVGADAIDVHLRSDSPDVAVTLLEETREGWRSICSSPCAAQVDPKDRFGVAGNGLHPSLPFRLESSSTLVASPASGPGFGLTYAGLFCIGHGGIFLATGLALGHDQPGPIFTVLGGVEVAVGIPLALLALYKASTRTSVEVTKGAASMGRPFVWPF